MSDYEDSAYLANVRRIEQAAEDRKDERRNRRISLREESARMDEYERGLGL